MLLTSEQLPLAIFKKLMNFALEPDSHLTNVGTVNVSFSQKATNKGSNTKNTVILETASSVDPTLVFSTKTVLEAKNGNLVIQSPVKNVGILTAVRVVKTTVVSLVKIADPRVDMVKATQVVVANRAVLALPNNKDQFVLIST